MLLPVGRLQGTQWTHGLAKGLRSHRFLDEVGFFLFDSDSGNPVESFFLHRIPNLGTLTRACWNEAISFETFIETDNSCCVLLQNCWRSWATSTTKLHSRYVKESELRFGVGHFGKYGVGTFRKVGVGIGHLERSELESDNRAKDSVNLSDYRGLT